MTPLVTPYHGMHPAGVNIVNAEVGQGRGTTTILKWLGEWVTKEGKQGRLFSTCVLLV